MKKQFIIIATSLSSIFAIQAQELSFDISPSFKSGVKYTGNLVESKLKPQLSLGFSFVYNFNPNWAVVTGVNFGRLNSQIKLKNNTFKSNKIDDRDTAFELRVTPNNFEEAQKQNYYRVPLLAQYTFEVTDKTKIYVALGGSYYGFTNQESKVKASSIQVSGYYPDINIEIGNAPNHGFGKLNSVSTVANTDYKNFLALSTEAGVKWNIKTDFYLGVFFDYGLTNLSKKQGNLVTYNNKSLNADKITGVSYLTDIGDPQFYNIGLKLRIGLFNLY